MTSSLEGAFLARAAAAGAQPAPLGLTLAGCDLDCTVSGGGVADVRTRGAPATPGAAAEALRSNPLRGWSNVVTPDGRLVRRLLLEPVTWMVPERLRSALDGLATGTAAPGPDPELEPVLRAVEAFLPAPGLEGALAVFLLFLDESAVDGTRHLLRSPSIFAVELAGSGLARRRPRTRREAAALCALATRPDAAAFLLRSLGLDRAHDPSESAGEVNHE